MLAVAPLALLFGLERYLALSAAGRAAPLPWVLGEELLRWTLWLGVLPLIASASSQLGSSIARSVAGAVLHALSALVLAPLHLALLLAITHRISPSATELPLAGGFYALVTAGLLRALLEFLGVAGAYHSVRRVSDLQRAKEALRRSQEQLFQAQKMEAVGRLAGGVAHDFNNLLTVIGNYTALVLEDMAEEDPRRADLQEVHKASERAARLTRQLLAFSRRQVMQPRPLDLAAVVGDMAGMLRRLIGENIALSVKSRPGVGLAQADPVQVEQILLNLVVNARDAIAGQGTITIDTGNADLDHEFARLHEGARPGSYVMLAVSDTGCGMDKETQRHVFDPFFTTKEKGKGTGLGLATVYGIVKQSGGYVAVYSEPGSGSVFRVYLPRAATQQLAPRVASRPAARPAAGTGTILLVEDEANVRELVQKVLTRHGYRVLTAGDGLAAAELASRHTGPIQLVLADVVMPHLSGRELVERLSHNHPEIRVLYMSGYADEALAQRGALGADASFLPKPFATRELLKAVRDALDRASGPSVPELPSSIFLRDAAATP
jgi:signal transduction histidine kinase/ActR/RegA family two-component response regulator